MKKKTETTQEKSFDFRTIKTLKDACKKTGHDPLNMPDLSKLPKKFATALLKVFELFIIFEAINDGWEADWTNLSQYKYYPWPWIKKDESLSSGFGFDGSYCDYVIADSSVGSRLCTNTREKAIYIFETFTDHYQEFFFFQK